MENSFKPHFDRIVGQDETARPRVESIAEEGFQDIKRRFDALEISKSETDRSIIAGVDSSVSAIVSQFGGKPFSLSDERIILLRPGGSRVEEFRGDEGFERGIAFPFAQCVAVERYPSDLQFALTLAHELFHLKSFKATRAIGNDPESIRLYRTGIALVDTKNASVPPGEETVFFGGLEEAIVAEATNEFFAQYLSTDPHYHAELSAMQEIKPWVARLFEFTKTFSSQLQQTILEEIRTLPPEGISELLAITRSSTLNDREKLYGVGRVMSNLYRAGDVGATERFHERQEFTKLLDELLIASKGSFDRATLVGVFLRANFSGKYLELARLIESTLGKGSFRRIATRFSKPGR